jgi:hypothetical protein
MSVDAKAVLARVTSGTHPYVVLTVENGATALTLKASAELRALLEACEEKARAAMSMTPAEQALLAAALGGQA